MKGYVTNKVFLLRKERGFTQEDLAKVLGISRQTVVAIEKGNYIPSLLLGIKIARAFKKRVEEIFIYET